VEVGFAPVETVKVECRMQLTTLWPMQLSTPFTIPLPELCAMLHHVFREAQPRERREVAGRDFARKAKAGTRRVQNSESRDQSSELRKNVRRLRRLRQRETGNHKLREPRRHEEHETEKGNRQGRQERQEGTESENRR